MALAHHHALRGPQNTLRDEVFDAGCEIEAVQPPHFEEGAHLWRQLVMDDMRRSADAAVQRFGDAGVRSALRGYLSGKLGVSCGTVGNRLRKLEDSQVIVGYSLRLRPDAQPDCIRAWMGVRVDGNQTRAVVASLLGEPGVECLHDTHGRWDLLAELRAGGSVVQIDRAFWAWRLSC